MKRSIVVGAALLSLSAQGCSRVLACIDCDYWGPVPDAGSVDRIRKVIEEPPCELGANRCLGVELQRCEADGWEWLRVCASVELCDADLGSCTVPPEADAGEVTTAADSGPELDAGQPNVGPDAAL
jgi:hypothetical protein